MAAPDDDRDPTPLRRFERTRGEATEFWQIRRDGIRCAIAWGRVGGAGRSSTSVRDDVADARRHVEQAIAAKLREGYVERAAAPTASPAPAASARPGIVATLTDKPHYVPAYLPVAGFDDVLCHRLAAPNPAHGFREYLVMRDAGASAVWFTVREPSHDEAAVRQFLEVVVARRDLPFTGRSHHKIALARPIGRFSHAVFCWPALASFDRAYPAIAGRVGRAFPIFDCELGDHDTEVLVDARISGRGAIPTNDWQRAPSPVIDLRYEIRAHATRREPAFKVHDRRALDQLRALLATADPAGDSFLELRSFRGEVRRLGPGDAMAELDGFLLGT